MRLIDADELKPISASFEGKIIFIVTLNEIRNAPTVDVVPVAHGEWKSCSFSDGGLYQEQCSVCGGWSHDIGNYCSNCGAKMDGERKENEDIKNKEAN